MKSSRKPDSDLPEALQHFVAENLDSLEQIDTLVLLARARRFWSAAEVTVELPFTVWRVEQALETLTRRGLLEVRLGTTLRYRFAPANARLAIASALVDVYPAAREQVLSGIGRNKRAVLDFARAFNLRTSQNDDD